MNDDKAGETPATHTAPENLVNDAAATEKRERRPIGTVRQLGKAFAAWLEKNPLQEGAAERVKPGINDPAWGNQPILLWNSWHRDEATGWNFNVFEGRLVDAASDKAMEAGAR